MLLWRQKDFPDATETDRMETLYLLLLHDAFFKYRGDELMRISETIVEVRKMWLDELKKEKKRKKKNKKKEKTSK